MLHLLRAKGRRLAACSLPVLTALVVLAPSADAGSGANFVTYNHHTADKGEFEVKLLTDVSNGNGSDYYAQLVELEYGFTDRWTAALYFEGVESEGSGYEFGGWRFENRLRLFDYGAFPLNPVLYAEYEELEPEHRYKRAVTGRAGEEEGEEEEEGTEHELELKLLLGQDIGDRIDVAFNWISEVNLDTGAWEHGYAMGLNYVLFETEGSGRHSWALKEVKLGLELFGGLGDSEEGLTLDPDETEQYAGLNLKGEFANGFEAGLGGAFGLTGHSEDAILRMMLGYEFD
jgi:hypothetical protein